MRADEHARPSGRRRGRRRSDRVADLIAWLVAAAALVVLVGAVVAGFAMFGAMSERATIQQHERTEVTAVVTEDVGIVPQSGSRVAAPVRWTGVDGVEHYGAAEVVGPVSTGDRVPMWIDEDQRPVRAPVTQVEVLFVTGAATGLVLAVGELLVFCLGRAAFVAVGRARDAEWEREWAQVEPGWSGR